MATTYYLRNTNADTSCDASAAPHDLSQTQGSGPNSATSGANGSNSFSEVMTFDVDASGDSPGSGAHSVQIEVTAMSARAEAQFRVQAVNSSCSVLQSSAYSSTFTSTGTYSLTTGSLPWAGANRLRVSIEIRRSSGPVDPKSLTVATESANSYIDAPWPVAGSKVLVIS